MSGDPFVFKNNSTEEVKYRPPIKTTDLEKPTTSKLNNTPEIEAKQKTQNAWAILHEIKKSAFSPDFKKLPFELQKPDFDDNVKNNPNNSQTPEEVKTPKEPKQSEVKAPKPKSQQKPKIKDPLKPDPNNPKSNPRGWKAFGKATSKQKFPQISDLEPSKVLEFKTSAYCSCVSCCGKSDGKTSSGTRANSTRTIAVDSKVIPPGSVVYIEGIGYRIAEDIGGGIRGNRIDVFFNSHADALRYGRETPKVIVYKNRVDLSDPYFKY